MSRPPPRPLTADQALAAITWDHLRVVSASQYVDGHWRVSLIDDWERWEAQEAPTFAEALYAAHLMMLALPPPPKRWAPADMELTPDRQQIDAGAEDLGL